MSCSEFDVQRERCFDQAAAVADLLDRERLEHHDLAMQLSKDFDPLAIAFFVGGLCHVRG